MDFPFDTPVVRFLHSLINTAGIGGIAVGLLATLGLISAGGAIRWIIRGDQADELETYAYPTPALHEHHGTEEQSPIRLHRSGT